MDNGGPSVLLATRNLRKYFPIRGGVFSTHIGDVRAVDGVSFDVRRSETLGLVGESGCGKTTVGRLLLRLIEPTSGHTFYRPPPEVYQRIEELYASLDEQQPPEENGEEKPLTAAGRQALLELDKLASKYSIYRMHGRSLQNLRGKLQIVFQDPFSSLSPRMLVRDIVAEPLAIHNMGTRRERYKRVAELLQAVGLNPEHLWRFPHEFSGGQRQRIGIARALALRPDFIVLDEPTSALDVSVQAQILNILKKLQQEQELSYLFISHHLSVVRAMARRVVVMYLGRIAERAPTEDLFSRPMHPYTQALLSAIPIPDPELKRERIVLSGDVPSPAAPPSGCRFHTRCPMVMPVCSKVDPPLLEVRPEHFVACHLYPTSFRDAGRDRGVAHDASVTLASLGSTASAPASSGVGTVPSS
jgi:oligopeptide/dipeptide ABC transporter ATP-binding protein